MLSFPAANRDPAMFPDADKVIIDRKENRHAAFGLGIHRCVGSNLARMEMTVAVEEFLKRIPDFELAGEVKWSDGRDPRPAPAAGDLRSIAPHQLTPRDGRRTSIVKCDLGIGPEAITLSPAMPGCGPVVALP